MNHSVIEVTDLTFDYPGFRALAKRRPGMPFVFSMSAFCATGLLTWRWRVSAA